MVRKCGCAALAERLEILIEINVDFLMLGEK
jgi:hypothetical protein